MAPITLTSYNGTSTFDGVDYTGSPIFIGGDGTNFAISYIRISNIIIKNYGGGISGTETSFVKVENVEVYNSASAATYWLDSNNIEIRNSNFHDTADNTAMFQSNWKNSYNMSLIGNKIHDNPGTMAAYGSHNLVDLFTCGSSESACNYGAIRLSKVTIANNQIYNVSQTAFMQHTQNLVYPIQNVVFTNNTVWNGGTGVRIDLLQDSVLSNNTILGGSQDYGFSSTEHNSNITLINNTVQNTQAEPLSLASVYSNITILLK